ncbi:MAG: type I methionyl aminopeptidase [Candidatus Vogelbacteria bacterium CG10_big_fil_rev_8_21_14_0_10_51_16]|uniref:Methionine aminopeptidase n=1 Tax=Candidatus Vogelbacteria bacterium CG10_big_fil_rev_8_21_14_0_10_51_16 TaxID=1975045 RepID=A0A2H0RFH8_9BACT|nr:MAG: type I methionyl aminopeptidase [Candidatus Vogelbacteria bacterium CG10_big_fil_rev_8_21_14_0_10_51_16]
MLIKTANEIEVLREGGRRLAAVLREVVVAVRPGVTELELDALAEKLIRAGGDTPAFKNYQPGGANIPFPATLCVSVNDAIVHGIPTHRALEEGDIVGLDIGLAHKGLYTDMARTIMVGEVSTQDRVLVEDTERALSLGISATCSGARMGDVGAAIEAVARPHHYGIVRELGGHGVGHAQHEKPYIPNYGVKGKGSKLMAGMVLALEPMFNIGTEEILLGEDGYTYRTADGSRSAHFEHTIVITESGPEVLTL